MDKIKICSRCIYDENVPSIEFDEDGVCNYCHQVDSLIETYGTGNKKGLKVFENIVNEIKNTGKNKSYDCIIGVSGGTDSSYLLHLAKEYGLRPLAVHYDNTWNTSIATENIYKITRTLDIDLYTHVIANEESEDLLKSFIISGLEGIDTPTDIALAEVLYRAANKYGVKYILEGHSFVAEGISPLSGSYMDGKLIESVHKRFGTLKTLKTFPNMSFASFMKWTLIKRIKKVRPLWYLNYSKKDARKILEEKYGWQYYGGHHLENRIAIFGHNYHLRKRFNRDQRNNSLSAEVRAGILERDDAINEYYNKQPTISKEDLNYFKKRLKFTDNELESIMNEPTKTFRDYPTYKKRFELLRPLFKILAKANFVPMSFYLKYCFPLPKDDKK